MKVAAFATPSTVAPSFGVTGAAVAEQTTRRAFISSAASATALAGWTMKFGGHSASCQCANCGPHAASCNCATCSIGHSAGCSCSNCLSSHSLSCQCANCMTSGPLSKAL